MRSGYSCCIGLLAVLLQACRVSPPQPTRLTRLVGISPAELKSLNCRMPPRNPWRPAANRDQFCSGVFGAATVEVHVDPRERVHRASRSWTISSEDRWRVLSDSVRAALTEDTRTVPCAEFDDLPFVHTELMMSLDDLVELRTIAPEEDDGYKVRYYELRVAVVEGAAGECAVGGDGRER